MEKIFEIFWRNATEPYGEWGPTGWGWLLLTPILICITFLIIIRVSKTNETTFKEQCRKIKLLGYEDLDDIQVFIERIGADLDDFILSKGIRKQYELFSEGKSSEFIKTSEENKKVGEGISTGQASGLATGIIIGSAINNH